jgi:hypothetical protein
VRESICGRASRVDDELPGWKAIFGVANAGPKTPRPGASNGNEVAADGARLETGD